MGSALGTYVPPGAQRVYEGPRFEVHAVRVPGRAGADVRRDVVVTARAATILPLLDRRTVVMIRNERFAVGQTLWELPAGTVELGEDVAAAAARELTEETGYRAGRMTKMTTFYPTPGICNERMHTYLAEELEHVGQELDENERIEVQAVTMVKVLDMVRDGTICDAKTIATLLYYDAFMNRGAG